MNDHPFAVLILENDGPAEIAHLNLAGFCGHLFAHRRGGPDQISMGMDGDVIVQR